jgi:CRISPR-associated protein Csh1
MIINDDALLLKKFFDWMKPQLYSQDRYLDEHFFMQKHSKNDEAEIKEFDYIPLKKDDVARHFKPIEVKNYLRIRDKEKNIIQDYKIKELWQLEEKVNELFYNNKLVFYYYKDDIKVSDSISKELQKLLFITKYGMNNYFRKFKNNGFENMIKKYGTAFVLDSLKNNRVFKAKNALNLKFAIVGVEMDIEKIENDLDNRLHEKGNYEALTRDEFLFLAGQWAYYLLSQSKGRDRTFTLAEHYFRAKRIDKLKEALVKDLDKYAHAISREFSKNKKAIALLSSYDGENKLTYKDMDSFLVGFTVDNLFYKTKEEKK